MNRTAFLLAILMLAALPALAQSTSEFGILVGGSKRVNSIAGSQGQRGVNDFKFSNSVQEIYYGVQMEPGTWLKLKAEQINAPLVALDSNGKRIDGGKGKIEHVDALIDYRFSEPFGSTGLFAGVGMYRQDKSGTTDTNFGVTAGVNADFPFSRRYGLVIESAYHYIRLPARPRYVTLNAGLRISF
jgi:hypothetical protein